MLKIYKIFAVIVFTSILSYGASIGKVSGATEHEIPTWFKQSFLDITEDLAEASKNNKHLMLFIDLDGCPYCTKMLNESFFAKNQTSDFIKKHFDVINLNVKGDREVTWDQNTTLSEKDLAIRLGIEYSPTVLFLDENKKVILRLNGYRSAQNFKLILEYVNGKHYLNMNLASFLAGVKNKTLYTPIQNKSFQKIKDLSKINTPLALIIEDGSCTQCEYFHKTTLKNKDVIDEFSKFAIVRFDANSDEEFIGTDGIKTTPKQFVKKMDLDYRPGIFLYDEGKLVSTIDALLYSFHFKELLRYVSHKEYNNYSGFLAYLSVRQSQLTAAGINIDLSK